MYSRSLVGAVIGLFSTSSMVAQIPRVTEKTIQLERFGFRTGSCHSGQTVQFLDDDRLLLSAPLVEVCDKNNSSNALQTQLTVIDLRGALLATKTRPDVYTVQAGPIGFATVCTESSLELIAADLNAAKVISIRPGKVDPCSDIEGLSPSRMAISIRDFADDPKSLARHRLIDALSDQPLAEQQFSKGDSLAGITDSGFAICSSMGRHGCEHLTVEGRAWAAGDSNGGSHKGMFLTPNQLLLPPVWTEKELISLSPDGKREQVADLRGFRPPNVDNPNIQISATIPRRILYTATGCYLGDFDDCYGFIFERTVVFDPQTHKALFKQNAGRDATSMLSPNGHTVVILDKTRLKIYEIP